MPLPTPPASLAEGELAYSEASGYLFIGETDGSVTAVGGETVVTKLAGIDDNANNYSLPTASGATLGGIKVGTGLAIDGSGVLTATGSGGLNEAQVDARVSARCGCHCGRSPGSAGYPERTGGGTGG